MPLWLPGNRIVLPKRDYQRCVLATRPYSLVGYWPLDDLVGSTARNLAVQAGELLVNSGLESYTGTLDDGASDTFTAWDATIPAAALVEATATVHGGSAAAKLTTGSANACRIYQTLPVQPGRRYVLSFWTRAAVATAGDYGVYDATNAAWILAQTTTGVTGVTYAQVSYTIAVPATCTSIGVYLWSPPVVSAACYFDDVSVSRDLSGAYTGVALTDRLGPFNRPVPFFDGSGDYANIYTAPLASEFSGAEGTLAGWCRVNSVADWTDAANRCLATIFVNASNRVFLLKSSTNNQWNLTYSAGGVDRAVSGASGAPLGWTHLALTWSAAADEVKAYVNGVQFGTTGTVPGVWAGTPGSTTTVIGSYNTTPASPWNGWLADVALWKTPLTQAEIAALARR